MDWSGKYRPVLERIACLSGKGAQWLNASFGGKPVFTDADIAACVAAARQKDENGKTVATCVRPELLMLHYAEMRELGYRIARAAWNATCKHAKRGQGQLGRIACVLAAEAFAGQPLTQVAIKRSAWIIGKHYEELEREIGYAKAWMDGELHEAQRAFVKAMQEQEPEKRIIA